MTSSVHNIDDIFWEHQIFQKACAHLNMLDEPDDIHFRSLETKLVNPLLRRCSPINQRRFAQLAWLEKSLDESSDHTPLILIGSLIVESELVELLAEPAREIGNALLDALEETGSVMQVSILKKWLDGQCPTTLGTIEILLLALRRGAQQSQLDIITFLRRYFLSRYSSLLNENYFGRCAAQLRTGFRNPAAHGKQEFQRAEHQLFARLIAGADLFQSWLEHDCLPTTLPPEMALLHHHLELLHRIDGPRVSDPWRSLWNLREQFLPDNQLLLKTAGDPVFRPGELLELELALNDPGWVTLMCKTVEGEILVLFPNVHRRENHLRRGKTFLPSRHSPECELPVTGPAGKAQLLAISSQYPFPLAWLPCEDHVLRSLTDEDLQVILGILQSGEVGGWTVGGMEIEIRL